MSIFANNINMSKRDRFTCIHTNRLIELVDQLTLLVLSATAAITHTLIPDHEIPLAMIGRARNWSIKKMAGITLIAGAIHISISMTLGVVAVVMAMAVESAEGWAIAGEKISGSLLLAFGIIYMILAWRRKGGHGHVHGVKHGAHTHGRSALEKKGSDGKPIFSAGWWIVAIVGIAPCVTLIPVMFAAIPYGTQTTLWVMFVYAVSTMVMMVLLTCIALKAIRYITRLKKIERHLELSIGAVLSIVGLYILTEDVLFSLLGIVH